MPRQALSVVTGSDSSDAAEPCRCSCARLAAKCRHGGIWVMFIPGIVSNLPLYILSILAGTVVTAVMLLILKRPVSVTEEEEPAKQGEAVPVVASFLV